MVFMFHSNIHLGCTYGWITPLVYYGAVAMTGFFMLSGFVICNLYLNRDFSILSNVKQFLIRRFASLWPAYIVVAMLAILEKLLDESFAVNEILKALLQMPPLLIGYSSAFSSLFNYVPNGGTWFVSCIMVCYVAAPFIILMLKQMGLRARATMLIIASLILFHAPLIVYAFHTHDIYSNILFRLLEFLIGMIMATMLAEWSLCRPKYVYANIAAIILVICAFVAGILVLRSLPITGSYLAKIMLCSIFAIPCFAGLIMLLFPNEHFTISQNRFVSYISAITYPFFLSQFFCFRITRLLILSNSFLNCNLFRVLLSFVICVLMSIVLYEAVQKPAKGYILNNLLRRKQ